MFDEAEFAYGLHDYVLKNVDKEKARAVLNQARIARIMQQAGSVSINGIGQKIGSIDARTFFRWEQQLPGCWRNDEFRKEFLRDNPNARAPGYTGHKK
jgi:hypothetical protein